MLAKIEQAASENDRSLSANCACCLGLASKLVHRMAATASRLDVAYSETERLKTIYGIPPKKKPKPKPPRIKPSTVYFVKCGNFVKIGLTSGSVDNRV